MAIKQKNFWQFFWKYVEFLAFFWHSNGSFPEGQVDDIVKAMSVFVVQISPSSVQSWNIIVKDIYFLAVDG